MCSGPVALPQRRFPLVTCTAIHHLCSHRLRLEPENVIYSFPSIDAQALIVGCCDWTLQLP